MKWTFILSIFFYANVWCLAADPNARDLEILATWFEGEFDNDEQIWVEGRADWWGNPEEKHGRVHTIHRRIKADSIGDYVFYVEEYMDDDKENVGRQRIVSFRSMGDRPGIEMELYFLREAGAFLTSASTHETRLSKLSRKDLFGLDGCNLVFHRVGQQYHGSMEEKACQFGDGDLKRYSVHDMIISEDQYWRVDRTFLLSDDSFHKGHPNAEPHKMRKVNFYSCDVSFYETAYYIPSEKDKKYTELMVHNQGGTAYVDNPIDGKSYYIQLRDKEYPFYAKADSDFFMLRLKEVGQQASVVLALGEPHPRQIGFQMGWASALCKLVN